MSALLYYLAQLHVWSFFAADLVGPAVKLINTCLCPNYWLELSETWQQTLYWQVHVASNCGVVKSVSIILIL